MHKSYNLIRHGDVEFRKIEELPTAAAEVEHNGSFVVALGEVTGHKHVIKGAFKVFEFEGSRLIAVNGPATISHEEHRTYEIPLGIYRQEQEVEYDPFSKIIRQVVD